MSDWILVTISTISLVFSCVSTIIAGLTAFYTLVRKRAVKMTKPTILAFSFDGADRAPKV